MSALLTKAFEKWVAECTTSNLPARPDAIIFALMEREPTREDETVPADRITYAVNELTCGQLSQDTIVCSAVVPDDCAFSYDWICLIHQASKTLCGVIKTPVRQKMAGESLIRNFAITYSGIAQAAQITVPPQSWQVDITPELKTALKAPNRLSEIAEEGEEAQQASRDNLGLKSAATMEPQSDIYDRTENRLAVPGAFGFGHIFEAAEVIRFSSESEFLDWVSQATPGEYFVDGSTKVIPGNVRLEGMVSIRWVDAGRDTSQPQSIAKAIIFYGINGDIYYNRCWLGSLVGWENLKSSASEPLEYLLSRTAGEDPSSDYKYPAVGTLILAIYHGVTAGDKEIRIGIGDIVPGSRLSPAVIACQIDAQFNYVASPVVAAMNPRTSSLPGRYQAMSGHRGRRDVQGFLCLFVRVE